MRRLVTATLVCAGALIALNCGGSGGGSPSSPSPPATAPTTITITGVNGKQSFSPNPADVPAGQSVVFKNNDVVAHRVMLDDGTMSTTEIAPGATSPALPLGGVSKAYHCSLHPSMVGSFNAAATPEPPPCTGYCG